VIDRRVLDNAVLIDNEQTAPVSYLAIAIGILSKPMTLAILPPSNDGGFLLLDVQVFQNRSLKPLFLVDRPVSVKS
jgi:hypothetical protein